MEPKPNLYRFTVFFRDAEQPYGFDRPAYPNEGGKSHAESIANGGIWVDCEDGSRDFHPAHSIRKVNVAEATNEEAAKAAGF